MAHVNVDSTVKKSERIKDIRKRWTQRYSNTIDWTIEAIARLQYYICEIIFSMLDFNNGYAFFFLVKMWGFYNAFRWQTNVSITWCVLFRNHLKCCSSLWKRKIDAKCKCRPNAVSYRNARAFLPMIPRIFQRKWKEHHHKSYINIKMIYFSFFFFFLSL